MNSLRKNSVLKDKNKGYSCSAISLLFVKPFLAFCFFLTGKLSVKKMSKSNNPIGYIENLIIYGIIIIGDDIHMIEIYTDGSCCGNGTENAKGGWAAVVYEDGVLKCAAAGREENTTNNICELKAILWAQGYYGHRHPIVYSDSAYAIGALTEWRHNWKANGWRRSKGEVKNLKLIQAFDKMESLGLTITLKKVKGHADCEGNILADKLATGQLTVEQVMK